jgi:Spy/CpxP family protein refolding chaperone
MMSFSKGAIAGYLGLVFVSGAAVGGFGTRLYTVSSVVANIGKGTIQSPEEMRKHFVNDMQVRLKLSEDQVMKLNLILDEARGRFHETQEKTRPELNAIRQNQIDSVRAMLTPEQRVAYENLIKEREERRKRSGPGHGPGF